MPSSTFLNLKSTKQNQVRQALLAEFSDHSLADAQVARIVKQAGIARGAFYKYFADLVDAYQYLYRTVMVELHRPITSSQHVLRAQEYVTQVSEFVSSIRQSPYLKLMCQHYRTNEGLLPKPVTFSVKIRSAREWAVMVLCHETIRACLLHPAEREKAIERLQEILETILK